MNYPESDPEVVAEIQRVVDILKAATQGENSAVAADALMNVLVVVSQKSEFSLEGLLSALVVAWRFHEEHESIEHLQQLKKEGDLC